MARGTKRLRGRSWELRYRAHGRTWTRTLPAVNGKAATTRKADEALRAFIRDVDDTVPTAGSVADLCDQWLAVASLTVSPSTLAAYTSRVETWIRPELGAMPVGQVSGNDIDRLYARAGRKVKPRTVRSIHITTHRLFAQAVHWHWLTRNPADDATPPPALRSDINPPDTAAVVRLVEAASDDRALALYILLAAVTGARRGELVGLQWGDIDWTARELVIRRSLAQPARGRPVVKPPKSGRPRRIALDDPTLAALNNVSDEMRGVLGVPGTWLFSEQGDGATPWRPDGATSRFRRARKKAGVEGVRLHDVRHYVATQLLSSGVDVRTVSGRLGHESAKMTLDVYAAFIPARDRAAAELLGGLIPRSELGANSQRDGR